MIGFALHALDEGMEPAISEESMLDAEVNPDAVGLGLIGPDPRAVILHGCPALWADDAERNDVVVVHGSTITALSAGVTYRR